MKRTTKLFAPLALLVIFVLALAACGGNGESEAGAGGTTATGTEAGETHAESGAAASIESPAADLRVTLDRLLGEHALLAVFAMQKGVSGEKDFEAIAGALDGNTTDLGAAIGSVYGDEAEQQFLELWRNHIGFFVDYTVATAEDDKQGRKAALDKLAGYRAEFSNFLDQATGGELPSDTAADALGMHVDQLTAALDQYAAGDYPAAYDTIRTAYEHMYGTGDALAGAIVGQMPEQFGS